MKFKSEFLHEFSERGFLYQCSNFEALDEYLNSHKNAKAYIGFDATADSLHVGHLTQIFILRLFQKYGYTPIVLIGGGTTKIGDPSGRDKSRSMLTNDQIAKNIEGIEENLRRFFKFDCENKPIFENNDRWLSNITYIDFLRNIGAYFSVNKMLTLEMVATRIHNNLPLSFLEFSYSLMQSYDFLTLFDKYDCRIQLGGSDQWGNLVNGIDLVRKLRNSEEAFGLTSPLLTTSDGKKMGKSASGAVWLDKNKFSVYDFWQYWRNVSDLDVIKFLKLFTDLPLDEIEKLSKLQGHELNEAKKILATEVTAICHGRDAAEQALRESQKIFDQNSLDVNNFSLEVFEHDIKDGISIIDILTKTGLAESRGEAKKLILGGGAYLNDAKITDINHRAKIEDFVNNSLKIASGKKKIKFVKLN